MNHDNTRIKLDMTFAEVAQVMAEGNPGAITVLVELMHKTPEIDPQQLLKGYGPIMSLDTLGIYGPSIWILYKDNCKQDIRRMIVVLRAWVHGFLPEEELKGYTCDDPGSRMLGHIISESRYQELEAKVLEQLESFKR